MNSLVRKTRPATTALSASLRTSRGPAPRRLLTTTPRSPTSSSPYLVAGTSAALVLAGLYVVDRPSLLAQSQAKGQGYESQSQLHGGKEGTITPAVFLWGRNTHNVAAPGAPDTELIRKAKLVVPFDGAVLRDLVLHETYGIAVDARGDVLQWGLGFHAPPPTSTELAVVTSSAKNAPDPAAPHVTLKNKDIITVSVADDKVYALSRKGEIFVFPAAYEKQRVGKNAEGRSSASNWRWIGLGDKDAGTDFEKMSTDTPLAKGEKFTSISAGDSHLLVLTSNHRAFAAPINLLANSHGQLGVRQSNLFTLPSPSTAATMPTKLVTMIPDPTINDTRGDYQPPAKLDPLLSPTGRGRVPEPVQGYKVDTRPRIVSVGSVPSVPAASWGTQLLSTDAATERELEREIRFCTVLHEIPALRGLKVVEMVAGAEHSIARTGEGRVLGWGSNSYGQLGLGSSLSFPSIPTPTEIPLARCYPKATRMSCERIAAGGALTYFIVGREDIETGRKSIDLLAAGNGQFGGIGNGSWAHAASPIKVKTISGLQEWNDNTQSIEPIAIKSVSVGKAHIAIVLDNAVEQPGGIKFGRDVFVWGHNEHFQLGTGKRSNLSTPQHLPPLPYPGLTGPLIPDVMPASGTLSPMPHSRLQLAPEIKVKGHRIEETIVAGDGGSAVYWRILDP